LIKTKEETMKMQRMFGIAASLLFAVIVMAVPQFAQAANTAAGVSISNQATVNYTVGTVPQTAVPGNTVTFVVDRVIYLTVTKQSDVSSAPSSTFQAIQFLVSNTSNTAMRFALSPVSKGTNTWDLGASAKIYRDNNSNALYDAGDTLYVDASTFGNIASGATFTVLIVGDIPVGLTNGVAAGYDLLATAVDAGTTNPSTETAGTKAANLNVVMTIFGDAAGSAVGDGARDGKHSASGTFTVTAAGLTVTKTATVYSDPINSVSVNAKAIPGAVITYTVTVTNAAGGANATNVAIADNLNAMITAGNVAFNTAFSDATKTCAANQGSVVSTDGGGTWNCQNGTWNSGTNTLNVSGLNVNAGSDVRIKYQVTIQ
jgi:hypothetical protein